MNIGDTVKVIVDRPIGSHHPKYKDMIYPINYGYVEGIIAGDGEEQDAYIVGIDKPLKTYTGILIAVIHRFDDVEDKWVVSFKENKYTIEDIEKLVYFQEKYYRHIIIQK